MVHSQAPRRAHPVLYVWSRHSASQTRTELRGRVTCRRSRSEMARKHSPRLLLKRTRAGEAIESPPFPSGGGNRGSGSRGWKTAGGLGLLALLDPIAAPPGDP